MRKREHPEWWALEIQSDIRAQRPPFQPPKFMVVGLDAQGVAAAAVYEELDGPGNVELQSMAVATRHRGRGGFVADEMFNEVLSRLDERAVANR